MRIESIFYEEQYIDRNDLVSIETTDAFLIKSNGEIIRKLNGETFAYNKATDEDFIKLEQEIQKFIKFSNHTVYFIDNMIVSIIISYVDGTKQIVERGLAFDEEYFDSIIEDYLDEFTYQ